MGMLGGVACPKSRPKMLDQGDKQAARDATDKAESKIVKKRSGGICEVKVKVLASVRRMLVAPCSQRAVHVHHMLGGWGRRGRGPSALAIHKQHVCQRHHTEITGHVLKLLNGGDVPRFDMPYERES